jgi:hypothetical protein
VRTISTRGGAAFQRVTFLPVKSMKKAKIIITTTSSSPVTIDGVAVLP